MSGSVTSSNPRESELAREYVAAIKAAENSAVAGEEEAQLTVPVSNLFCGLCAASGLGTLRLIRETRTGRTRPDFAAVLKIGAKVLQKGYVELKAPSISVDATRWSGRNAK